MCVDSGKFGTENADLLRSLEYNQFRDGKRKKDKLE